MQNKFLVFVLVIIFLSGLAFKPALAKDNKNQPVFDIAPKKSFGNLKFGDSRKIVENKLKSILKNKCYCKDDSNHTIFNCIDCLKEPLNFYFDDDKFNEIRWSGFGFIKYKKQTITKLKTNINDIKKLFPGGKLKNVSIEEIIRFKYYVPQSAMIFEFHPIEYLYYDCNLDKSVKKQFKYKYCFDTKNSYKYYNCYVLTNFLMFKSSEDMNDW